VGGGAVEYTAMLREEILAPSQKLFRKMDLVVLSSASDGTTALWEAARAGSHAIATYRDNTPLLRGAFGVAPSHQLFARVLSSLFFLSCNPCAQPSPTSAARSRPVGVAGGRTTSSPRREASPASTCTRGRGCVSSLPPHFSPPVDPSDPPSSHTHTPFPLAQDAPVYRCATPEPVTCLATSADGTLAAAGSASGKLYVWDVGTGDLLRVWQGHYKAVTAVSLSPCGLYLASGGQDCAVHVWDVCAACDVAGSGAGDGGAMMGGGGAGAGSSGGGGPTGSSGQPLSPLATWTAHTLPVTQVFFPSATGGVSSGALGGSGLSASASSLRVVSASLDRTVRLLDVPSRQALTTLTAPAAITCITPLGVPGDPGAVAVGCVDGSIVVLGSHQQQHQHHQQHASSAPVTFAGHTATVTSLASSPDGLLLVSGGDDGLVRVWDVPSRQQVGTFEGHKGSPVLALLLLPRPPHLALAGKHAPLPLLPLAPLKKHPAATPLEWRGSTTGPTGRDRYASARLYVRMDEDAAVAADRAMRDGIAVLTALHEQQREHAGGAGAGAAGAAAAAAGESDESPAALRERIVALEAETVRWREVNNKLVARLQAAGGLQGGGTT
jgi:WD40 repeat protein